MRIKLRIAAVLMLFLCITGCSSRGEKFSHQARILIVHSYHIEYPWTHSIDDGIMHVLNGKGYTIRKFFMDTKRNDSKSFKINQGKRVLDTMRNFKPQVIITSDDDAQEYVGKQLVNNSFVSVVFCGVNSAISLYNYPANNVTGVCERAFIRSSLELLKKVVPNVSSFTILSEAGNTSQGFIDYLNELNLPIQIDNIVLTHDFHRWKDVILSLKSDALIIYMYYNIKEHGKLVNPDDVLSWTIRNLKKPSIGFADFGIEGGILLGRTESGFEQGELAAQKVVEIIQGKNASEIPIDYGHKGLILINRKTAAKLGIDISPLKSIADRIID